MLQSFIRKWKHFNRMLNSSSVDSSKYDLANSIKATFELAGFNVEFSGEYQDGHQK